ncbi:ImmA/IrrE family metallo-endopeptidase [Nocardioides massiliensis]|uniref:ImmA/IrrE family metallo-endopeptidase n=1 Tax=Nocardioides massiliensis TaxID=1325935 RepID=UPI0035207A6C
MAHELAHIDLGHHEQLAGCGRGTARLARRREVQADGLAARRLVRLDDLIAARRAYDCPWLVAEHLDVTEHMLRVRIDQMYGGEIAVVRRGLAEQETHA